MTREQVEAAIATAAQAIEGVYCREHPSLQPEMVRRILGELAYGMWVPPRPVASREDREMEEQA